MRTFNTIISPCPHCAKDVKRRIKSTDRMNRKYRINSGRTPWLMMAAAIGIWKCSHCKETFFLRSTQEPLLAPSKVG
jgi:ribosomal protein L37AE/L43A